MTTREDRAAVAEYLTVLRDAAPSLSPTLVEAFERLTPAQFDLLAAGALEAPTPEPRPATARTPKHPWFSEGVRTALVLGGAFAVSLAGVAWASLSFDQGPDDPAVSSVADPTGILEGIGQASAEGW